MKEELGFARCGLACCVCGENENCAGCHSDGCKDRDWCKNRKCCIGRGLNGCWQCPDFPCQGGMLDKPRIRAFAAYLKKYGEKRLLDCLRRNEQAGVLYHYQGELVGDYDLYHTQDGIWNALEHGISYRGTLVKESLTGTSVLDQCQIEDSRTDGTSGTLLTVASGAPRFPDALSRSMAADGYATLLAGDTHVIVFAGKVMRYASGDAEARAAAQAYGAALGISMEPLPE